MNRKQMKWLFVLVGALVLLAACQAETELPPATLLIPTSIVPANVDTGGGQSTLPAPVTLTPVPTTIAETQPTATAVSATTTPIPPSSTPAAATTYRIAFVEDNDVLNVRSGAGVANGIVGELAPGVAGVSITGNGDLVSGSTWVPVTDGKVTGWVNGRFLTEVIPSAQFCADQAVLDLLAQLKTAVEQKDNVLLAQLIHPERGLRIRVNWWNPEVLLNGDARATLFTGSTSYDWGVHDGSGEPFVGSFSSEILPMLQEDLLRATEMRCNDILAGPTAGFVQLPEGYDALNYYSLYRPAADESGFDWGTWVVGVERWNGRYYLSYLVHFEWEI
ncbi:MAG: hypothetical protein KC443_17965 [Anaerolineales bacterium]|nr:hypothetical protein [Anaerolineales bacterium]